MHMPFSDVTAHEARALISAREVSPVELTRAALDAALETQDTLNAFSCILEESAMCAAREIERKVMAGEGAGTLLGLPISVKDLIAVAGAPLCFGSKAMADNTSSVNAPSVQRVLDAGAIIIGKTTTSEFGCKPVGDSPLSGITRNPWDTKFTPGGSSAGAAASVAAGVTPFALGTDGGGSIRIPAAFCGLTGLKAQFGRIPVWPASSTPTLAHVGPLAKNSADIALLFSAIAGYDERDPFSVAGDPPNLMLAVNGGISNLRIAWSSTLGYADPDPGVVSVLKDVVSRLERDGADIQEVDGVFSFDPDEIWTSEFYAGVGTKLRDVLETRRDLLDPSVASALDVAIGQEMYGYYRKVFDRYALRDHAVDFFSKFDILLSPVTPVTSLLAGMDMPEHLTDRNLVTWAYFTYPFNLTGQPAASVCGGFDESGLPVGIQVVGRALSEFNVMRVVSHIEKVRGEMSIVPPDYRS